MLTESSVKALMAGSLPPGTRWFLVAAIPIEDPQALIPNSEGGTEVGAAGEDHALSTKVGHLIEALQKVEPNDARGAILRLLRDSAAGAWVSFPSMIAAVEAAGVSGADAPGRAQAALRDLSWQLKTYLPATDLAGCTVAIDVLATRRRFGKETRYRLTEEGRAALVALAQHGK